VPTEPCIAVNAAALRARARSLSFIAHDIAEAIADIREKLGPDAIILDIRRLPARGLSRFWQTPRIQVLACRPDPEDMRVETVSCPASPSIPGPASAPRSGVPQQEAMQRYARAGGAAATVPGTAVPPLEPPTFLTDMQEAPRNLDSWRCAAVLERLGLTPLHVERVLTQMQEIHGAMRSPPESMIQELALARQALLQLWRPRPAPPESAGAPLHVFVGPPGVGKSTVLCKWLAQTMLLNGQAALVWRLDGRTANASEIVSLYGEILGVRVERNWSGRGDAALPGFVDFPGVDFQDAEAMQILGQALAQFPGAQVHLVLNAAYTTSLLLAQARGIAALPVTDLILTHLDEETAWGKLWNLVLGTNCALGFLSAGQNIPGRFCAAHAESLCAPLFGGK
jgi:flagellar biosynthesis protein FlhF